MNEVEKVQSRQRQRRELIETLGSVFAQIQKQIEGGRQVSCTITLPESINNLGAIFPDERFGIAYQTDGTIKISITIRDMNMPGPAFEWVRK